MAPLPCPSLNPLGQSWVLLALETILGMTPSLAGPVESERDGRGGERELDLGLGDSSRVKYRANFQSGHE